RAAGRALLRRGHRRDPHPRRGHRADHVLPHPARRQDGAVPLVRRRVQLRRRCGEMTTREVAYRTITVRPGANGWGRGLELTTTRDHSDSAFWPYEVVLLDGEPSAAATSAPEATPAPPPPAPEPPRGFLVRFGGGIGHIINTFLAAGRQSINLTLNTILPFM